MNRTLRILFLVGTHTGALGVGFALGIYLLPIITAPASPSADDVESAARAAQFTGKFQRDLEGSDALHWGEGTLYVARHQIVFEGRLAPGPDYRLYLSPELVETETNFEALQSEMVEVGPVRTFSDFMIAVPSTIDPAVYRAAIIWCETFGEFITAGTYN